MLLLKWFLIKMFKKMGKGNRLNVKSLVLLQCCCVRHCCSETPKGRNNVALMCVHADTSIMPDSAWPYRLQTTRLLCPWYSLGKNTGMDCHALLQGIFPTQGLNPDLLLCRKILYNLSFQGSLNAIIVTFKTDILKRRYRGQNPC